jgi:hypothetical protein
MTKKYGKNTFRNTKKNILHKKGINTKKRGLRGGDFIDTTSVIDNEGLHGIVGLKTPELIRKSLLSKRVCDKWFENIKTSTNIDEAFDEKGSLKLTSNGRKDYDICSHKLGDNTIEQYKMLQKRAIEQGEKVIKYVTNEQGEKVIKYETENYKKFKTELETNTSVKLTLDDCEAYKKYLRIKELSSNSVYQVWKFFKYNIFSPAATTEPPSGGAQIKTLVGTFTQLPVSFLLQMAGQETPFSFASFYGINEERKPYFSDYLSCLENVKQYFGPEVDRIDGSLSQSEKFRSRESSILREFGKSAQCKIVFVAGNVGIQIQDPENGDAIFVLPSQLNGAEYQSPTNAITDLNKYKYDKTAGPLGQLSFNPVVAQFVMDHAARTETVITDAGRTHTDFTSPFLVINAIDNVIEELAILGITSLTLKNGYLLVPEKLDDGKELVLTNGVEPSQTSITIFDSLSTRLKVLQTDDVPTSGLKPPGENTEFNSGSRTTATPIYASAVPLCYHNTNTQKSMLQYCVAGFDLVAQYFGAMVSAYNKSKQSGDASGKRVKLFLTPLGGGAFNNPREMIACSALLAYYQAQQLFDDFDAKVEVIFLAWDCRKNDGSIDENDGKKRSVEDEDFIEFFNTNKDGDTLSKKVRPLPVSASEATMSGGHKSRHGHGYVHKTHHKHARKTRHKRTHRSRAARKHKKYTRKH